MKITESTLKEIIMEEIANLDLDEVKLAPAIFDALKKMGRLPKGAEIDFSKGTSKKGSAGGRSSADLSKLSQSVIQRAAKAASKRKQGQTNPVATKFDVMKKLEKKVGKMAMKVIVGALEKDQRLMTTLSMVLKEEAENTEVN